MSMSSITGNGTGHIYYNITLTNNDLSDSGVYPAVSFTETRNTPFLNCPEDYNMSVVRFNLETPTLPVLVCQPDITGSDINKTIYNIRLRYFRSVGLPDQIVYANVVFQPSTTLTPQPTLPLTPDSYDDPYYNLFSYNAFVLMVNNAISTAFATLTGLPPDTTTPYLSWDTGGNLAILTIQELLVDPTYGVLTIGFDTPLFTLFSSFNSLKIKDYTTSSIWYNLVVDTGPSAVVSSQLVTVGGVSTTVNYYQVIQEYTTCPLWSPVDSIVFTTSMLPINPELNAAPVVYNSNRVFQSIGTNANLTNVLTDFIVGLSTGTEYKPNITYTPPGEYRLVGLFGRSPASSIQVNVFYKNRFGTLIPLTLGFGCSASIKIMFRRKDFSNVILSD